MMTERLLDQESFVRLERLEDTDVPLGEDALLELVPLAAGSRWGAERIAQHPAATERVQAALVAAEPQYGTAALSPQALRRDRVRDAARAHLGRVSAEAMLAVLEATPDEALGPVLAAFLTDARCTLDPQAALDALRRVPDGQFAQVPATLLMPALRSPDGDLRMLAITKLAVAKPAATSP